MRIGTCEVLDPASRVRGGLILRQDDLVAQQALGLFDTALEIADGVHLAQVHPDVDERLGDLGRQPRHDDVGAEQSGRLDGLHEVVRHGRVDVGHPVMSSTTTFARLVRSPEQLLRELPRALGR